MPPCARSIRIASPGRSGSWQRPTPKQRVLAQALDEGGWFGTPAHQSELRSAVAEPDEVSAARGSRCSPRKRAWACS